MTITLHWWALPLLLTLVGIVDLVRPTNRHPLDCLFLAPVWAAVVLGTWAVFGIFVR